ncbi:Eight transmembrane protein EpsH [Hyella patelloides LEGE 07179]|uniref:Eight transmembrane protein EpsH n=1 Tax=Hyella patelloides LEGE 07179 TaxID=945734 RepID=A0A563W431_9CYAN|nr:cyanoexosortase B [Hyella patelloides]VEP18426.1 Eight transmembrane protein EpsH [Hyella patelloides LEGE 07179]
MQVSQKANNYLDSNFLYYLTLGLLAILYAPLLIHWYDGWLNKSINIEHEYFSHGIIGLPFAAYISWSKRKKWQRIPDRFNPWGGFFLILGIIFYTTGVAELVSFSFPMVLAGICLCFKGISGLKLQTFPLFLVFFAAPNSVPYLITSWTLPLQKFIAVMAGFILTQFGMDVAVEEIYLSVGGRLVEVAPYCAGLKMLFTTLYVGSMLLYWTDNHRNTKKVTILLSSAVIISVIANIIRNTVLTFFHGTGRDQLFVWLHDSWGGDLYSAMMLGIIVLLINFLDNEKDFVDNPSHKKKS